MQKNSNDRLLWLDSLRGIAALMVAIFHFWMYARLQVKDENSVDKFFEFFTYDYFDIGKIGVVLFFAISGFIIPYSLFRYKDNHMVRFIMSRFFRLYPVYWVSILLVLLLINDHPNMFNVIANITMFQKFIGQPDLLGVYWTLQIELIFYFICAALFITKLLQKHTTIYFSAYFFICVAFVLSVARYITEIKLPVAVPLALSIMFFGILWMRLHFKQEGIKKKQVYTVLFVILGMIVPISLLAYNKDYGYEESWYRYTLSYYTAIGMFVLFTTKVKLVNPVFIFLGKISYSLYLMHLIVSALIFEHSLFGHAIKNIYLLMAISLIISLITSTITYYLVEKPFIKLGKNLVKKITTTSKDNLSKAV
ncbi:acyltransferase [Parageobacillus genomosp. 1]|uniref:Acyltransferase n=1 Tax=Parageobacillus genomosp. 1 TaxID=1295642 RepID=A0ABC9VGQ2_9BACL|nr:acyltransferase [Parageobacillus genomosp. 1]EZP77633.1 acyltransferase [Parageobacillus genomosp. 1]